MESLRLATGCQIDIPGAREGADASARAEIKLKGTKKQVEEAKKLLQERVKVYDDTKTETVEVDRKYHRTLIGGSGKLLALICHDLTAVLTLYRIQHPYDRYRCRRP